MPAPRWVKKRDGRPEPYDEGKVARSIARAAQEAGRRDEALDLARELARSVTFFLGRGGAGSPDSRAIFEAVERALEETGHATTAQRFREHREWRSVRRAAVKVRETPVTNERPPDAAAAVEVLSAAGATPWTKRRIVETLRQEAGLGEEVSEDVARAVEERVFSSGLTRVGSALLRELIDAELFERGFSAHLARLELVGVAKPDLHRLVSLEGTRASAAAIESEVSRAALERFALDDLVGGEGAAAHRRGEVHFLGLGRPYRLAAGAASAPSVASAHPEARTALQAARLLLRAARTALASYDLAFGLARCDLAFAPFAQDPGLADAIAVLLDGLVASSPDEAALPWVTFGIEAASEDDDVRLVRDALVDAFTRRGPAACGARLALHVRPGCREDEDAAKALERTVTAARAQAPVELALLPEGARPATSRGHAGLETPRAAGQIACVNVARAALEAGRGERGRLSAELGRAVDAAVQGLSAKRQNAVSTVVRPGLPLWRPRVAEPPVAPGVRPRALEPDDVIAVLGVVGLDAGLRYFAGESPSENRRVARLAREVVVEVAALAQAHGSRLGLAVRIEDAQAGEAPERFAAVDLDRFPEARELVEGRGGWDPGLSLGRPGQDPTGALGPRLELATALSTALVLPRGSLASADPAALAAAIGVALG